MPKKPAETRLENLDAALSDVPSNAHASADANPEAYGLPPPTPPKKPRTESPERIALRAHQKRRELAERMQAELDRHHERVNAIQGEIERHDADCEGLPAPVRALLEKLAGAL